MAVMCRRAVAGFGAFRSPRASRRCLSAAMTSLAESRLAGTGGRAALEARRQFATANMDGSVRAVPLRRRCAAAVRYQSLAAFRLAGQGSDSVFITFPTTDNFSRTAPLHTQIRTFGHPTDTGRCGYFWKGTPRSDFFYNTRSRSFRRSTRRTGFFRGRSSLYQPLPFLDGSNRSGLGCVLGRGGSGGEEGGGRRWHRSR